MLNEESGSLGEVVPDGNAVEAVAVPEAVPPEAVPDGVPDVPPEFVVVATGEVVAVPITTELC